VRMKAVVWDGEELGAKFREEEIPADLMDKALEVRGKLIDAVADEDDAVMNKYLEGQEISIEEIKRCARAATIGGKIVPVFAGSAFKNKGIQPMLDGVIDYLPCPLDIPPVKGLDPSDSAVSLQRKPEFQEPFSALAFKILTDPF